MSMNYGSRRDRPRVRLLKEETESEKYKRLGRDPRKTYEENMGYESVFDRPDEELDWPDVAPQRRKPTRQVRELAAEGRGNDTEVAHVTNGEYVIPREFLTPELLTALRRSAAAHGVPLERLIVGNIKNSINPNTGTPEFWLEGLTNAFDGLTQGFSDFFNRKSARPDSPAAAPDNFMSELPSVRDAAKNYDFSNPNAEGNGMTPEMRKFTSPWSDIDKDKLTGILYNEMSSFRGDPQKVEQAMWATANTITNRQADGTRGDIENGRVASPVIPQREMQNIQAGNPDAKRAYNMASGISDLITSAPDAFPSSWPYTQYNHRDTASRADHAVWGTPSMLQYGPFDTYNGQKWLNIYGPKPR